MKTVRSLVGDGYVGVGLKILHSDHSLLLVIFGFQRVIEPFLHICDGLLDSEVVLLLLEVFELLPSHPLAAQVVVPAVEVAEKVEKEESDSQHQSTTNYAYYYDE